VRDQPLLASFSLMAPASVCSVLAITASWPLSRSTDFQRRAVISPRRRPQREASTSGMNSRLLRAASKTAAVDAASIVRTDFHADRVTHQVVPERQVPPRVIPRPERPAQAVVTTVFLVSGTSTSITDWNAAANTMETIAGGGGGGDRRRRRRLFQERQPGAQLDDPDLSGRRRRCVHSERHVG